MAGAAGPPVIIVTGWSGAGKSTTGDYLALYHGFYHLDGDNIMRDKDERSKDLTAGLVKAFYEHWFKNEPAPPELWKPYLDALALQCQEALKSHDKIALTFSVYRREARDYFRQLLPDRIGFLKLQCDPDIVIQSALGRVEKYMALSGKTVEDWWRQQKKDEVYGPYNYENYKRMQLAEYLSGMEPFDPDEEHCATCDVSARGAAALRGISEILALKPLEEEPDLERLKRMETDRLEAHRQGQQE